MSNLIYTKVITEKNSVDLAAEMLKGIPGGYEQAMVSSLNRALLEGRTAGTRAATARYTLPAGIIRGTMAQHRASKSKLEAELASRGRALPMRYYKHKPHTDTTGAKRQQAYVAIKKEGKLRPLWHRNRGGFIYHGSILRRVGDSSLPVVEVYSLAVPHILNNQEIVDIVQEKMRQSVIKRLEHETERLLREGFVRKSKWS